MAHASAARKQKRAAKVKAERSKQAKLKLAAKAKGDALATQADLESLRATSNEAFQQLSQNQERLGKTFNQNLQAIQGAFAFVDAHQFVFRRIMNDLFLDRARPTPLHPEDAELLKEGEFPEGRMFIGLTGQLIDYEWYYGEYQKVRFFIRFMDWVKKGVDDAKAETPAEPEPTARDEDFVFGGDYASQNG